MAFRYPKRLKLALTPTPLEFMPRLTEYFGGPRIYFKRDDLTGCPLSGNKIRKLEFSLAEALSRKAKVVISAGGIQSNHCRATALACTRLGLQCHLILRGTRPEVATGNLLLDGLAGATCSFYQAEEYSARKLEIVEELSAEYAADGKKTYWIPVGASNAIGSLGYMRAFDELATQARKAKIRLDHVVTAMGSGGTAAGLAAGRRLLGQTDTKLWGVNVCDDAESFRETLAEITSELNARFELGLDPKDTGMEILDGYVGEGYAIPYTEELELIQAAAHLEGQILDPVYTGKALYGLQQEIELGRFGKDENVVFVHTGGIFGLFPHSDLFGFNLEAE